MSVFTMPQLGESDVEGTVLRWLKQPGEPVKAEEPLVEIETEKVTVEVPSPFAGVLAQVLVQEGETVPVGADLAVIDDGVAAAPSPVPSAGQSVQETIPNTAADTESAEVPSLPAVAAAQVAADQRVPPPVATLPPPGGSIVTGSGVERPAADGAGPGRTRFSPAVLRLANEHGLDPAAIRGTGIDGRVTRKDVVRFVESGAGPATTSAAASNGASPAAEAGPLPVPADKPSAPPVEQRQAEPKPAAAAAALRDDEEIIKPSPTRLTIARNMVRAAQTIPVAWMVVEVDATGMVRARERWRDEFRRREGVDLTYLPFVIQALVQALGEQPLLNSQWRDDQIVLKKRINIGVAVGSDDGLIVPVIHDANRLSIAGLAHAVADLAERARARRLRLEDVQGGTFTIDNTGVFGSLVSQPIINPPQCAILSTEAVMKRPVVTGDAIAIRSMMNLCISFDHRIVDGSHVGPFMQGIKRRLEAITADTAVI